MHGDDHHLVGTTSVPIRTDPFSIRAFSERRVGRFCVALLFWSLLIMMLACIDVACIDDGYTIHLQVTIA